MDKRILKTKKCLKESLRELMCEKPFEKITVTEICKRASTGRVTFYNYYEDKYDLMEDCFEDLYEQIRVGFHELQRKNNPQDCFERRFQNFLDSIHDVNQEYMDIPMDDSYTFLLMYYRFLTQTLKKLELYGKEPVKTRYDVDRLNSFLVLGFWGFFHVGGGTLSAEEDEKVRESAHQLVRDLAAGGVFQN